MKRIPKPTSTDRISGSRIGGDPLDLTHLAAVPLKLVALGPRGTLRLYLIGCGGTGSWLAPHVVRLARFLRETHGMNVQATFIDPDVVEPKNIYSQNFCQAEIGAHKAETLALRLGPAWCVEIGVQVARFDSKMVEHQYGDIGLLIGCVDNAGARKTIADALDHTGHGWNNGAYSSDAPPLPQLWWLDAGNGENTGQVLLGSTSSPKILRCAFPHYPDSTYCVHLPAPHLQHPDLLETRPDEPKTSEAPSNISCAQMVWTGDQSPSINSMVANIAASYLWRMFTDRRGLTTFATYCNLEAMSVRSRYIMPEGIGAVLDKPAAWFEQRKSANRMMHPIARVA
ncbi:MAG: ThiF family adenylyltransferase [Chloroflexi bacterium]|nr:ThiF family adenylyltransferase [Chloroflexota bacterium]